MLYGGHHVAVQTTQDVKFWGNKDMYDSRTTITLVPEHHFLQAWSADNEEFFHDITVRVNEHAEPYNSMRADVDAAEVIVSVKVQVDKIWGCGDHGMQCVLGVCDPAESEVDEIWETDAARG